MDLFGIIKKVSYKPLFCKDLPEYYFDDLGRAINEHSSFILKIDRSNSLAISWWVSPKRTRSYPYARVYDTLNFTGKKITIIPVIKDEGKEGDRDFLQWDTVSLMSLLGVYVIIAYYSDAEKSNRYSHKITNQRFEIGFIRDQINNIISFQSDAVHWNTAHLGMVGQIAQKAIELYEEISTNLHVDMHSVNAAEERINEILKGKDEFIDFSRTLAERAQKREQKTIQPKEKLSGIKGTITIQNYLGGFYYITADEIEIDRDTVFLVEGKHSATNSLPSSEDIKDGLLKMILFTNLEEILIGGNNFKVGSVLKLTADNPINVKNLSVSQTETLKILQDESRTNNFLLKII